MAFLGLFGKRKKELEKIELPNSPDSSFGVSNQQELSLTIPNDYSTQSFDPIVPKPFDEANSKNDTANNIKLATINKNDHQSDLEIPQISHPDTQSKFDFDSYVKELPENSDHSGSGLDLPKFENKLDETEAPKNFMGGLKNNIGEIPKDTPQPSKSATSNEKLPQFDFNQAAKFDYPEGNADDSNANEKNFDDDLPVPEKVDQENFGTDKAENDHDDNQSYDLPPQLFGNENDVLPGFDSNTKKNEFAKSDEYNSDYSQSSQIQNNDSKVSDIKKYPDKVADESKTNYGSSLPKFDFREKRYGEELFIDARDYEKLLKESRSIDMIAKRTSKQLLMIKDVSQNEQKLLDKYHDDLMYLNDKLRVIDNVLFEKEY